MARVHELLDALTAEIYRLWPPDVPEDVTHVKPGEDLQAALIEGAHVSLEAGGIYEGSFRFPPRCRLTGNGAHLVSDQGPAIDVPINVVDVVIEDVQARSAYQSVVLLGRNDSTQTARAVVPANLTLRRVVVPTHRGKRAFEVNAAEVQFIECGCEDVWSSALADSQGIAILNTPGPVTVTGGRYVAASENILVGGDTMKLPDTVPSNLLVDHVELTKPEAWHTDGVKRVIKTLLELKAGSQVTVKNCRLWNVWKDAQDGYAIVITPRNGQSIADVLIEACEATQCGGGINLMGDDGLAATATQGVVVKGGRFEINKAAYGGRGIFALITNGMREFTVEDAVITFDGNAIVQSDTPDGKPQGPCTLRGCTSTVGAYGVTMPGSNWGNPGTPGRELFCSFTDNLFPAAAPAAFKRNFPANQYGPPAHAGRAERALLRQMFRET